MAQSEEFKQKRRSSTFETCKLLHLKLVNSVVAVLIFLIRLLIVIISAMAIYVANYCRSGDGGKKENLVTSKSVRFSNQKDEDENSTPDLSNSWMWVNECNMMKKPSISPMKRSPKNCQGMCECESYYL